MQRGRKRNRQLDVWVGTPLLNLLATFRRRRKRPVEPRKIAVMCSPALGDTLLFSGALQDLRAAYPSAEIIHVCMKQNLAAAEIIPGANRRLVISLTDPKSTIKALRAEHFDIFLDFTSWQRLTAFYTLASGANYTVGFLTPGQNRSRGYDRTVLHRDDQPEPANFRDLLTGSGLSPRIEATHAPAVDVPRASEPVFAHETDILCFHLWASGQRSWFREWPEDRWIELAKRLAAPGTLFLITGAPSDRERTDPFVAKMKAAGLRCEAFVSPDGFRTLTAVLRRARLTVSVNTGVMHLAAVAHGRVVAINGPNSNRRWGPVGPYAIGVEAPGEGCGYLHLGFNFDGQAEDCMERTSVDLVEAACRDLLAGDWPEEKGGATHPDRLNGLSSEERG